MTCGRCGDAPASPYHPPICCGCYIVRNGLPGHLMAHTTMEAKSACPDCGGGEGWHSLACPSHGKAIIKARAVREALVGLKLGTGCWCKAGSGLRRDHTDACKAAQVALEL